MTLILVYQKEKIGGVFIEGGLISLMNMAISLRRDASAL
jgi:hypothetical protein